MSFLLSKPFNLVAFNCMWLGCVLGRESLVMLVGPAVLGYVALLIVGNKATLLQIALPALVGIGVDTALTAAGVFAFDSGSLLIPLWLMVLWLAFATTLSQSMQWAGKHKLVAALAGATAFPFNYAIGERIGAVSFPIDYLATVITLAIIWAMLLPMLYLLVATTPEKLHAAK